MEQRRQVLKSMLAAMGWALSGFGLLPKAKEKQATFAATGVQPGDHAFPCLPSPNATILTTHLHSTGHCIPLGADRYYLVSVGIVLQPRCSRAVVCVDRPKSDGTPMSDSAQYDLQDFQDTDRLGQHLHDLSLEVAALDTTDEVARHLAVTAIDACHEFVLHQLMAICRA